MNRMNILHYFENELIIGREYQSMREAQRSKILFMEKFVKNECNHMLNHCHVHKEECKARCGYDGSSVVMWSHVGWMMCNWVIGFHKGKFVFNRFEINIFLPKTPKSSFSDQTICYFSNTCFYFSCS